MVGWLVGCLVVGSIDCLFVSLFAEASFFVCVFVLFVGSFVCLFVCLVCLMFACVCLFVCSIVVVFVCLCVRSFFSLCVCFRVLFVGLIVR